MKFLKAVRVGLASLIVAMMIISIPIFAWMWWYLATLIHGGYYVVAHWHVWRILSVSVLAFAAGFSGNIAGAGDPVSEAFACREYGEGVSVERPVQ